jgi:periplasmic divalent cation tolerance protein
MSHDPNEPRPETGLRLLFTTVADADEAHRLAKTLVRDRLAACVSILGPARSVYRWQAGVETAQEWPLMIKTTDARLPALKEALQALHPYEVPELIALTVVDGLPAYLAWAREACAESAPDVAGEAGAPR